MEDSAELYAYPGSALRKSGQPIGDLVEFNKPVVAAANNDPRFIVGQSGRDMNSWPVWALTGISHR